MESESEVTQSCSTLFHPMDCSLPGSSARGILQARILEWIAISFSSSSVWPLGYDQHQQEGAPRERLLLAMRKDSPKLKLWTSAAYIVTWEVVAEVQVQQMGWQGPRHTF